MIDPVSGKVIGEGVKAVTKASERYLTAFVGLLGGDYICALQERNIDKFARRTEEILKARNVTETADASPSLLIELAEAGANESADELRDLYAKLLAAAIDPSRKDRVRASYIQIVKQLDPLDALVLLELHKETAVGPYGGEVPFNDRFGHKLNRTQDEISVSTDNLVKLELIVRRPGSTVFVFSPLGRTFMRAVTD